MQAYAKLRTDTPELLDLVAQFAGQDLTDDPMAVDGSSTAPVANSGQSPDACQNLHSTVGKILVGEGSGERGGGGRRKQFSSMLSSVWLGACGGTRCVVSILLLISGKGKF